MKMKALALSVALGVTAIGGVVSTAPVQASGIPVLDVANLMNAISQYTQMVQQLAELQAQLQQAKQQYESITGGRGMGNLARTNSSYIPTNWQETLALMEGNVGGELGNLADQIRQSASKLDQDFYSGADSDVKEGLQAALQSAAAGQAMNAKIYDSSEDRLNRLNSLANQVDSAADLKAVSDLQARISIENGMLMNELIRLQSMNAMYENQRRVQHQASAQATRAVINTDY